ncbi:MAG: UDP-N-acetylmuramoyl-tripeptide--D-alanyl-D-alanine ligase, partial [Boseongicola sp. SB0670_bin_30]|nr:UDP-N-acetylmuramoyl-tripeptide--D-alanyl-D-alanine ligase [Boseongicola sp. SB0670_bin_30]
MAAVGGISRGAAWEASGVSIDTRTLEPGDLFVALHDRRDGHDFVADAFRKGAAAALVSRVPEGVGRDASLLICDEVQTGLERLAAVSRSRTVAKVIAVTGSAGKTSTKEMLRHVLGRQGRTHASEASFNNHWGVPLTLARMPPGSEFAVIEIGMNRPGEIVPL